MVCNVHSNWGTASAAAGLFNMFFYRTNSLWYTCSTAFTLGLDQWEISSTLSFRQRVHASVLTAFHPPGCRCIYTLYLMSDSYLGLDQQYDIYLNVKATSIAAQVNTEVSSHWLTGLSLSWGPLAEKHSISYQSSVIITRVTEEDFETCRYCWKLICHEHYCYSTMMEWTLNKNLNWKFSHYIIFHLHKPELTESPWCYSRYYTSVKQSMTDGQ